jgi:hypothetical protein
MKILVEVELRCREHERCAAGCDTCQLLRQREQWYQRLRSDRARLMAAIKQSLAAGNFIIIDAR